MPTKKEFREYLNAQPLGDFGQWAGQSSATGRVLGPRKRPYGDYLYAQDRAMFDFEFEEWKERQKVEASQGGK